MRTVVGIAVAGALGALARYGLEGWVSKRAGAFPWGTFVVNVTGAFLLGFVFTLLAERLTISPWIRSTVTRAGSCHRVPGHGAPQVGSQLAPRTLGSGGATRSGARFPPPTHRVLRPEG